MAQSEPDEPGQAPGFSFQHHIARRSAHTQALDVMTLIQARTHERLSALGIPPDHRGRYLSQASGLTPERADSLLSGTLTGDEIDLDHMDAIATALEVPGWWLVLPFDADAH